MKINTRWWCSTPPTWPTESSFWAGLLGGTVDAEDDWHMVFVEGSRGSGSTGPDHVPPDWPHGNPQQITSISGSRTSTPPTRKSCHRSEAAQAAAETESPDTFQVYADPAGHPFCLCWVKDA